MFALHSLMLFQIMFFLLLAAIFRLLFESRIGCLQDPMPPESQGFISAVDRMFQSGQIMFLTSPEFFRKYKLKPWRDHEKAWDYIFNFGKFPHAYFFCLSLQRKGFLCVHLRFRSATNYQFK